MKKTLYLFRHGESEWNADKTLKYSKEVQNARLTEKGVKQAKELAEKLKYSNIQYIYASSLIRAVETSQIVADALGVQLEIVDNLKEFSLYDDSCIGLRKSEIADMIGLENREKQLFERDEMMDWRPLNCETKREARTRIYATILHICEATKYDIIGIGSHGTILKEFLRACNYENDSNLKNCECFKAEFDGEKFTIYRE